MDNTIGKVLECGAGERDCVHVAIMPVISDDDAIYRGNSLKLVLGTSDHVRRGPDNGIGVADPFLTRPVRKGERFWMFLRPGTITGLRHHWTHPLIDAPPVERSPAENWLRQFADRWNMDYDELIAAASRPLSDSDDENYIIAEGISLHRAEDLEGEDVLFWQYLSELTQQTYDRDHQQRFVWSCSC